MEKVTIIKGKASDNNTNYRYVQRSGNGAIYGLGFIGALVYYISTATGFWMGVLGVLKALVWPAFLVFGLLKHIGL
jgi:hypothetical protein